MITVTLKTGKLVEVKEADAVEDQEGWVRAMKGKKVIRMFPRENVEQVELNEG